MELNETFERLKQEYTRLNKTIDSQKVMIADLERTIRAGELRQKNLSQEVVEATAKWKKVEGLLGGIKND